MNFKRAPSNSSDMINSSVCTSPKEVGGIGAFSLCNSDRSVVGKID